MVKFNKKTPSQIRQRLIHVTQLTVETNKVKQWLIIRLKSRLEKINNKYFCVFYNIYAKQSKYFRQIKLGRQKNIMTKHILICIFYQWCY